ncbi:farnesol dehydrogenase [Copidosoma floridanum]|uniref:farnesol dehydrogenase n=1 Tax=Copidosoma floridanum TaxID=29053 RepID=UPI0006C94400|nr:farnesol dehydrogenase [Copidosoma floridanum]
MNRWSGKVAVVTGASSGIGLETAKFLVQSGVTVIGLARRRILMEEGTKNFEGKGNFYIKECDVSREASVDNVFDWIKNTFGTVNILINNAGSIKHVKIENATSAELDKIIDVNFKGLIYCTKRAIELMKENKKEAHIINVNSILGHIVPEPGLVSFNIYPATKFAVSALSETLRNSLCGLNIRVTSVSPGLTKTRMMSVAGAVDYNYLHNPALEPKDVADAIIHVLRVPERLEINELTLQANF